jgi:hypothetical protein
MLVDSTDCEFVVDNFLDPEMGAAVGVWRPPFGQVCDDFDKWMLGEECWPAMAEELASKHQHEPEHWSVRLRAMLQRLQVEQTSQLRSRDEL